MEKIRWRPSLTRLAALSTLLGGVLAAIVGFPGPAAADDKPASDVPEVVRTAQSGLAAPRKVQAGLGPWKALDVHSGRDQYSCTYVNAYSTARGVYLRDPGSATLRLALWVDTKADVHNASVFKGCRVKIFVDIIAKDGTTLQRLPNHDQGYDAFAGAVLDPQGSDQWYPKQGGQPWSEEATDIHPSDWPYIDRLEITVQNAS